MALPSLSLLFLACDSSRRSFLGATTTSCAAIVAANRPPAPAVARDDGSPPPSELYLARPMGIPKGGGDSGGIARPSAPLECLLPAARVGVYIYQALAIAEELTLLKRGGGEGRKDGAEAAIQALGDLLLTPPSFVRSGDPVVTRGDPYGLLPPLVGEVFVQQQKQRERRLQSVDAGVAPQLFEFGELVGERRQWNRLVRAERAREGASEVRLALNIYTTNLNFDPDRYVYSGSKGEKSSLIREGRLPTATDVIRSDLDARDLYRNAVQTALEDAGAEFAYQKRNGFGGDDAAEELVRLLGDARAAIDRWFGFIPDVDIREALEVVRGEQKS